MAASSWERAHRGRRRGIEHRAPARRPRRRNRLQRTDAARPRGGRRALRRDPRGEARRGCSLRCRLRRGRAEPRRRPPRGARHEPRTPGIERRRAGPASRARDGSAGSPADGGRRGAPRFCRRARGVAGPARSERRCRRRRRRLRADRRRHTPRRAHLDAFDRHRLDPADKPVRLERPPDARRAERDADGGCPLSVRRHAATAQSRARSRRQRPQPPQGRRDIEARARRARCGNRSPAVDSIGRADAPLRRRSGTRSHASGRRSDPRRNPRAARHRLPGRARRRSRRRRARARVAHASLHKPRCC